MPSTRLLVPTLWLVVVLAAAPHALHAQRPLTRVWAEGSPALTTLGLGTRAAVGVTFDRHVLTLRGTTTARTPGGETWDVGLLYGRTVTYGRFQLRGGTGVAVTGGRSYSRLLGDGDGTSFGPVIGFPLEGHVGWVLTGFAAVGIHAFADVNTEHPFGGIGVYLRLGRLR